MGRDYQSAFSTLDHSGGRHLGFCSTSCWWKSISLLESNLGDWGDSLSKGIFPEEGLDGKHGRLTRNVWTCDLRWMRGLFV